LTQQQTLTNTPPHSVPAFLPLTGIYEPSAIVQLADGRFLVVEDEKSHPFSLVTIHANGRVDSTPLNIDVPEADDSFRKLNDLEGTALDRLGNIYAITSHSRDDEGDKKKSRHKLVRFRIEGDRVVAPQVAKGLKSALRAAHPVLAAASKIRDVKNDDGLNIEALEFSPDQQSLLIGFRSPLLDNRAIIARVENPAAMFDTGESPRISPTLMTLDLGGNGIRGMAYLPARPVRVAGLPGVEHAEGVSPAVIDGQPRIVIVSDDGSRKAARFARFMLLDPDQLQIA
jgi:hypothetical protein